MAAVALLFLLRFGGVVGCCTVSGSTALVRFVRLADGSSVASAGSPGLAWRGGALRFLDGAGFEVGIGGGC